MKGENFMNSIVTQAVRRIREDMPSNPNINQVKLIYTGGNTYQLFFTTKGCRYACTVCNYNAGKGHVLNEEVMCEELRVIIENFPGNARVLVLEAAGSFLDESEISRKVRNEIMSKVAQIRTLDLVVIETHYTTVTKETLKEIAKIFEGSSISVELEFGVESVDTDVLEVYNKDINKEKLLEIIWEAEEHGIACELNFMLGAPVLTTEEQIQDVLNSIEWVMQNCPEDTTCVLFPINIKRHSLLFDLWKSGQYEPISHWEFVEMLSRIPEEYLERILIAWWGNRFNVYDGPNAIIYPSSCDECHDELQRFYEAFYTGDKEEKRELLKKMRKATCRCKEEFFNRLKNERRDGRSIRKRWNSVVERIKEKKI